MNFAKALADVSEHHAEERDRYYGIVAGVVTNAKDDAGLGRVKARLRGMDENAETDWLAPAWPGGIEGIPHKSDPVLVFFEDGNENKGAYLWFPSSKTNDRPSEAMVLGLTFASMYNDLVERYNALRLSVWTTTSGLRDLYNAHIHPVTAAPGNSGVTTSIWAADDPGAASKMQKADGSTVTSASGSKKALSGRVKVGI